VIKDYLHEHGFKMCSVGECGVGAYGLFRCHIRASKPFNFAQLATRSRSDVNPLQELTGTKDLLKTLAETAHGLELQDNDDDDCSLDPNTVDINPIVVRLDYVDPSDSGTVTRATMRMTPKCSLNSIVCLCYHI